MKFLITLLGLSIAALAVDINTANVNELKDLKGVGQVKAERIIEYRDNVQCFSTIEELTNVAGIGYSVLKDNRTVLTASSCDKKDEIKDSSTSSNTTNSNKKVM